MREPEVLLEGAQFDAFRERVISLRAFLRNKFDMDTEQQATFLMNALVTLNIDLKPQDQTVEQFVRERVENYATCMQLNFNSFFDSDVSITVRSNN